ncbi:hypothetical protein BDA96_10G327600 [Sorghum bicolor]|uniref:Uncharacterized protein n=1 Tax=Sorghum bicolor TaxID=4558 RepID=A0A921Q8T7_SORBI|nr:hypothetical protein BDA96_10G327600 [Sorghum bicolor]
MEGRTGCRRAWIGRRGATTSASGGAAGGPGVLRAPAPAPTNAQEKTAGHGGFPCRLRHAATALAPVVGPGGWDLTLARAGSWEEVAGSGSGSGSVRTHATRRDDARRGQHDRIIAGNRGETERNRPLSFSSPPVPRSPRATLLTGCFAAKANGLAGCRLRKVVISLTPVLWCPRPAMSYDIK